MKMFFKFFGCSRARTKHLSSVTLLKDNDTNTQKLDKSFNIQNKNNGIHIKIQFQKLVLIIKIIIKIHMDLI